MGGLCSSKSKVNNTTKCTESTLLILNNINPKINNDESKANDTKNTLHDQKQQNNEQCISENDQKKEEKYNVLEENSISPPNQKEHDIFNMLKHSNQRSSQNFDSERLLSSSLNHSSSSCNFNKCPSLNR
eukprot:261449_1